VLIVRANSGSLSALSTAVCAAALTMTSGRTVRMVCCQTGQVGEVATQLGAVVVKCDESHPRVLNDALQFPADLAAFAEEKDFHGWYCFYTQSRYLQLCTLATQSGLSRYHWLDVILSGKGRGILIE
jgi:hypothetical protein